MLTPEDAARLMNLTPRTIYRWVEARRVHFTESEDGNLLICLASFLAEDVDPESRSRETPAPD